MEEKKTINIQVEANDAERISSLINAIDFNDKEQLALLLWTKVRDRKISFNDAAELAGITWDEMEDIYRSLDLLDYQVTEAEFKKELEAIDEVYRKRCRKQGVV